MAPTRGTILVVFILWLLALWMAYAAVLDAFELIWWLLVAVLGFWLLWATVKWFQTPRT